MSKPRLTVEEFNDQQKVILSDTPPEFHAYFSYLAWEQGHSAGFEDVLICLHDLIGDGFKQALAKYTYNILKNR